MKFHLMIANMAFTDNVCRSLAAVSPVSILAVDGQVTFAFREDNHFIETGYR